MNKNVSRYLVRTAATKTQPAMYLIDAGSPGLKTSWETLAELAVGFDSATATDVKNRLESYGASVELIEVS